MSSGATAECPICFNDNYKFKVLNCGHQFCTQCCEKLLQPPGTGQAMVIECPKCRAITDVPNNGVESLKSHFFGYLMCYQCDTRKLTKDFQWCHTCNRSVCSECFIEKHRNPDGCGIHESSKWDAHMGIKAAVGQLMQTSLNHKQITEKCKMDVAQYLDGLKIYLAQKLDEAESVTQAPYRSMTDAIAQAYGISQDTLIPSQPLAHNELLRVVNEAKQIAQIAGSTADLAEVHFRQFPYEQLEKSFLSVNVSPPKPSEFNRLSNLQSKLLSTECIAVEKCSNPIGFAVYSSTEAIILDMTGPYHFCNSSIELILLQTERTNNQEFSFGEIVVVPRNRNQVMITGCLIGYKYILLTKGSGNKFTQHSDASGALAWSLPSGDKVIASTERIYTFSKNCIYAYDHAEKLDFTLVFRSAYQYAQFTWTCHVQEGTNTTDFYLFSSPQRKQLEIIQLDRESSSLVSWRKINLSLLCPDVTFARPMMCAYDTFGLMLLWDRQLTTMYMWNPKTNTCALVADFKPQSPQVIQLCDNSMYMLLREMDVNRVERIEL